MKTAAVLIIGDEILSGRTQDSNLAFIAQQLLGLGIPVKESRVVGDVRDEIIAAVNALRNKYDYVFTTGGIGPTHDDITAESIAAAFDAPLQMHAEARKRLIDHYGGEEHLTEPRARMARVPEGGTLIDNPVSAAPGFQIGNVFVLPGVPKITQAMFPGFVSRLQGGPPILSVTVTCNVGESSIAVELGALAQEFAQLSLGSYPYFRPGEKGGSFGTSLVWRGTDIAALRQARDKLVNMLQDKKAEAHIIQDDTKEASP